MDFGAELRQARERKGIPLRQISATTRISMRALEALERNDVSRLPGGIFTRAIIRSYSLEVGLDPNQTTRDFLAQFPAEAPPQTREDFDQSFENRQRIAGVFVGLVILGVVIGGASLLYFSLRGGRPAQTNGAAAAVEQTAPTSGTPSGQSAAAEAVSAASRTPAPASPELLTLAIQPDGQCWVALTADGTRKFGRVLAAGERESAEARDEIVVEVGDAAAFKFAINGYPGRTVGTSGQVVTLRINRQNYRSFLASQ